MKEIRAYIQPFMLPKLTQNLLEIPAFPGMTVSDCEGFGQKKVSEKQDYNPFRPKKRIEIFCTDEMAETIYSTIMEHANTHQHGAGKICVIDVLLCERINTGERRE